MLTLSRVVRTRAFKVKPPLRKGGSKSRAAPQDIGRKDAWLTFKERESSGKRDHVRKRGNWQIKRLASVRLYKDL